MAVFPYDPTLLATVGTPPQTIADVLHILLTIDATCADGDGLKWFNWLYLQVTLAVETRVAAGGFSDPPWLADLDVQFARLYFSALQSALSGQATPDCWHVLFSSRSQAAIARIQYALAGINAHINHDLPEAIVSTCQATGTTPDRGTHYNDYTALNTTLDGIVESAKLDFARPSSGRCASAGIPAGRYARRLERQCRAGVGVAKCRTPLAVPRRAGADGQLDGYVGRLHHRDWQDAVGAGALTVRIPRAD